MSQYMYLGPSRPFGLPLANKMLFRDEPRGTFQEIAKVIERIPSFARLFVPIEELADARKALAKPGTAINLANAEIMKLARKEKNRKGV